MKKAFLILLISLGLTGCLTQEQYLYEKYQKGKTSFEMKQYRSAFEDLHPVAKAGNANAQYAIGYLYFYGKGIIENKTLAHYWMNQAAKQGHPLAKKALQEGF